MAQTQFRSDDTVSWWLKFGDGSDGDYSSSGNATDAPVDSACSGTSGTTSLSATNASFANGEAILIHQTRGTGAGNWELNQISSYTAGTITTISALKNSYVSGAQVIQLKQYSSFTQNSGHTLTAKAWNGTVGGIIAFLCNGNTLIDGTININGLSGGNNTIGSGRGFRGGVGGVGNTYGIQGESSTGAGTNSASANGMGGGAGIGDDRAAGGGGYATAGTNATTGGLGGGTGGTASLTTIFFGGAGGGGSEYQPSGQAWGGGGGSGGIAIIISKNITGINSINLNGGNGGNGSDKACGGAGAGGSCLIKSQIVTLGSNKITASGGTGGSSAGNNGGNGGVGRIHLDYLTSYTGTTSPTINVTQDATLIESSNNYSNPAFFSGGGLTIL